MNFPLNVLGIGANSSNVGMVFLNQGQLKFWQSSPKAAKSVQDAKCMAKHWLTEFQPDIVVTEKLDEGCRKSELTQAIITTFAQTAEELGIHSLRIHRPREYQNKYNEAVALAARYPAIKPWVPKRKFYDPEPRNVVIFEALAHADHLLRSGTIGIAAKMG
jgi:predicted glycosyltransferase